MTTCCNDISVLDPAPFCAGFKPHSGYISVVDSSTPENVLNVLVDNSLYVVLVDDLDNVYERGITVEGKLYTGNKYLNGQKIKVTL